MGKRRGGFTLVEVMIACIVLAVGLLAVMSLFPSVTSITETSQEGNLAINACRQMAEAVRQYADQNFAYTYSRYNGTTFTVSGLTDAAGSSTVGSVTCYVNETGTGDATLDAKLGLPKDLVGTDGGIDTDVSLTYELLPFRVAVDWKDHLGLMRHTEVFSQVADY